MNLSCHPVSLPHLVDFDWRVDVKTSSDSAARMAQPTCIVQMKVTVYTYIHTEERIAACHLSFSRSISYSDCPIVCLNCTKLMTVQI